MRKFLLFMFALTLCATAANATTWSVIGAFNGWGDNDPEMTQVSENVYTITLENLQGEFKFRADHDWAVNLGATTTANLTGNISNLRIAQNGPNFKFEEAVSNVTLTINVADKTLTVSGLPNDMEPEQPKLPEVWGVIGNFNGWSGDVNMTKVSDNVYSATLENLQGEFKFRADHGWTVNLGAATISNLTGNVTNLPMTQDGLNFKFEEAVSNVTLTINVADKTLTVSGLPNDMEIEMPKVSQLYLIGDPAGQWDPATGLSFSYDSSAKVFTWSGMLYANNYFGFSDGLFDNWNDLNAHRYGPESDGASLALNTPMTVNFPKATAWKVEGNGFYTLMVDLNDMTLTADRPEFEWSIIGQFNNWENDLMLTKENDGIYFVDFEELSGSFKFRADREWNIDLGGAAEIEPNKYQLYLKGNDINLGSLSNVRLTLDVNNFTLTVSSISGVDVNVSTEEAPVYFNMQGVRVANPENGLYIRVANGHASKVVVK